MPPQKKKPVSRAKVRQRRLVRAESATIDKWLRQTDRSNYPVKDRLEALLWSWPVCRTLDVRTPKPLWKGNERNAVLDHLDSLARTLYPDMWFPEALYSTEWQPYDSSLKMHDADFKTMCRSICDELRKLPGIAVPDPLDNVHWVCTLLEYRWGDGQRDYRQQLQETVIAGLTDPTKQQVCEIGERARDAAYRHVRTTRVLDAQRLAKEQAMAFKYWLREARTHMPFVEEHIADFTRHAGASLRRDLADFYAAFQVVTARGKRVTEFVNFYMGNLFKDKGRDRRAKAGRPGRAPWVEPADRALQRLKIPQQKRRDLLIAWGLVPLERHAPPGSQ